MIGILIFCILALAGFCMMSGEDMLHKTDYTITAIGVAKALAESNVRWVPEIMINGQEANSNTAMDAVGLNMLLDIAKKQSK